jgi:hypothetical protein
MIMRRNYRGKIISLSAADPSVPASVLATRIDMVLHAELSPIGFERARPRRWVEGRQGPIRKIFEFQALKGEQYSACWGFSVDFVPFASLVTMFDERSKMKFRRFSLENYSQTHIAWGLCLLAVRNRDEAETHLTRFCETFSIDRNDRILQSAERIAINAS